MTSFDLIGWASSLVLLATLVQQVRKQWKSGKSEGVSSWLFVGQLAASIGFTVYSVLLGNWVFAATNAILVINAMVGQLILIRNRRRAPAASSGMPSSCPERDGMPLVSPHAG